MSRKAILAIDGIALAIYLVAANPSITGIPAHEWLGVAVLVALIAHCTFSLPRFFDMVRACRCSFSAASAGSLALDALILIVFMACLVSGAMVSGTLLPAFGFVAHGYYFWDPLHATSAKMLLALLLVHIVMHWRWIASFRRKKDDSGSDDGACR